MNVENVKTMLQQDYQDIIDDGEVETGTEEWLCLLEVALKVNGVVLDDMYDILNEDEKYIKYPKLKELDENGYVYVNELNTALEELGVEFI